MTKITAIYMFELLTSCLQVINMNRYGSNFALSAARCVLTAMQPLNLINSLGSPFVGALALGTLTQQWIRSLLTEMQAMHGRLLFLATLPSLIRNLTDLLLGQGVNCKRPLNERYCLNKMQLLQCYYSSTEQRRNYVVTASCLVYHCAPDQ